MRDVIVFTVRLVLDDWQARVSAWNCPTVDIPTVFIKTAYDPNGKLLAPDLFKIEKGPARVSWKGPGKPPAEVTLGLALGEELSPASEERFWKGIALVVPIVTALIGVWGGWMLKVTPTPEPGPSPAPPVIHSLFFRVDPNDLKDSGMPPARITVNNQEINQVVAYKVEADITAIVDTTAAYRAFVNNKAVVSDTAKKIDLLFGPINTLHGEVTGLICSGGSNGVQAQIGGRMGQETTSILNGLRDIRLELGQLTK
jgi:hypothetical protein